MLAAEHYLLTEYPAEAAWEVSSLVAVGMAGLGWCTLYQVCLQFQGAGVMGALLSTGG